MMSNFQIFFDAIHKKPVVPVLTIAELSDTLSIGQRLYQLGYHVLEVTLRTPAALDAIRILKAELPDSVIGAGTILTRADIEAALEAGSDFLVTPATSAKLVNLLSGLSAPVIPGCTTATEAQNLYDMGFEVLKFFPAEASGGIKTLEAMAAPLPHLKFMATGGLTEAKAEYYLALPNVIAVGGTWMVNSDIS